MYTHIYIVIYFNIYIYIYFNILLFNFFAISIQAVNELNFNILMIFIIIFLVKISYYVFAIYFNHIMYFEMITYFRYDSLDQHPGFPDFLFIYRATRKSCFFFTDTIYILQINLKDKQLQ